ncbi:MAG: cysteine synthase family protein [Gemmatimonadales bacterium]
MQDLPPILAAVGNTPTIRLTRIARRPDVRVLLKLEGQNPTGSMKDRMALGAILGPMRRGQLTPGMTVVEYTGGSTGTSLAFVCAALGLPITIVTSDAFSQEKRDHMRALGANVIELPSEGGRTTRELIQRMIAAAQDLAARPQTYYVDQFNNPDAAAGYYPMAQELHEQAGTPIDLFVQSVGTAQCLTGAAHELRRTNPAVRIVAVEPAESAVLAGGPPGPHKIEGVGPGFVPPRWRPELAEQIVSVSTADAKAMARRLAREEGIFAGTSTGANVVAALQVAETLPSGSTIATIACDTGLKYLSTDLYKG